MCIAVCACMLANPTTRTVLLVIPAIVTLVMHSIDKRLMSVHKSLGNAKVIRIAH